MTTEKNIVVLVNRFLCVYIPTRIKLPVLIFLDNKKKSRKGGVNAKRVDNLGIGTVMILDERTIQPGK